MKKLVGKIISTLLFVSILLMAIPLSANAMGGNEYYDVTSSKLAEIINSNLLNGIGSAEFDATTNTVKLLSDISSADEKVSDELWIMSLADDVIFDLNGYSIYNVDIIVFDDDYNTITFKDSVGSGKIVDDSEWNYSAAISLEGSLNVIIEGGTYIGRNSYLIESEGRVYGIDTATNALKVNCFSGEVSVDIRGGTFIGGNGLNRQDIDANYIENAAAAIETENGKMKNLKISQNAVIKGGSGENVEGGAGIKIGSEAVANTIEIDGAQITGGNGSVGGDAIYSAAAVNLKLTDTTLTAGAPGGKEINVPDGSNVETIKTPTNIDHTEQGVNVKAADGVFPKNTVVKVTPLTQGDMADKANIAFGKKFTDFRLYDITAKLNDSAVQPNGEVVVTFNIPENFNIEKTSVYYIDGNGATQKLESQTNAETRTIAAKLTHFSAYAVVDESEKQIAESSSVETVSDNSTLDSSSKESNTSEQITSSIDEISSIVENSNVLESNSSEDVGTSFYEAESSNNKIVVIIVIAALVSCLLAVGVILVIKTKNKGKNI